VRPLRVTEVGLLTGTGTAMVSASAGSAQAPAAADDATVMACPHMPSANNVDVVVLEPGLLLLLLHEEY
jgi:hypothetical protein